MQSPPTSEAGAAIFSGRRGRGPAPTGRGGAEKRGRSRGARGAPLDSRAWGSETWRLQSRPPGGLPSSEGRGRGARQKKPNLAAPAGDAPRPPQPPPAPAAGAQRRPPRSLPRRRKVFTPALERRQLTESPPAPLLPTRRTLVKHHSPNEATEPEPRGGPSPPGGRTPRLRPAAGRGALGRWPARPALIAAHTPGEVAPEPLAAPPRNPRTWRRGGRARGVGARAETAARPARRAHLSCQGPAAPPRLTHAGATVAQCLSKLLISPGAARRRRRRRRRLWPAGEVELPGPRPRNTCCCRRRRGHTQAQRRPLSGHWLAPGSLTSASGRCRVSAANTRARARAPTGARVHPRGHTPLPRQAGQVSRGHQQVGEVPPSGSRGPRASLLRGPTYTGVRDQPLDSKSWERSLSTRPPGEQRPCASPDCFPSVENSVCHKADPPRSERTNSRVLEAS